jgi:hypothetical protein
MADTKKYLDQIGLAYLWQKLKSTHAPIHIHPYIKEYASFVEENDKNKVAVWNAKDELVPGNLLGRDVNEGDVFANEAYISLGNLEDHQVIPLSKHTHTIVNGETSETIVVNEWQVPFADGEKDTFGVVKSGVEHTNGKIDLTGFTAAPIVDGVVYYKDTDTQHPVYGTTGSTGAETLTHSGTFDAITGVTVDNGHVTGYTTKTFTLPDAYVHPTLAVAGSTGAETLTHSGTFDAITGITVDSTNHLSGYTTTTFTMPECVVKGATGNITALGTDGNVYSTVTLEYNNADGEKLLLKGLDGALLSTVDLSTLPGYGFKDGVLKDVNYIVKTITKGTTTYNQEPKNADDAVLAAGGDKSAFLELVWTIDAKAAEGTELSGEAGEKVLYVNVTDLLNIYTGGDGISIDTNNVVSVDYTNDGHNVIFGFTDGQLHADVDLSGKVDKFIDGVEDNVVVFGASGAVKDIGQAVGTLVNGITDKGATLAFGTTTTVAEYTLVSGATGSINVTLPSDPTANIGALTKSEIDEACSDTFVLPEGWQ